MVVRAIGTPEGRAVIVRERNSWKALFGISFWEHGLDRPIGSGLSVTAYALDARGGRSTAHSPVRAVANPRGAYIFHTLPAWSAIAVPEPAAGVAIEIRDPLGRFLPAVYITSDPLTESELFWTAEAFTSPESPPGAGEPRFYLFSSPARRVSPRFAAVVRAQVWDRDADRPAAFAVLEIGLGEESWYGLADERGSALVAFPYPEAPPSLAGSPDPDTMSGLFDQSWELSARVRYQGGEPLPVLPGFGVPELGAIAGQPHVPVIPTEEGMPVDSIAFSLVFGRETALRTGGESVLWV